MYIFDGMDDEDMILFKINFISYFILISSSSSLLGQKLMFMIMNDLIEVKLIQFFKGLRCCKVIDTKHS